MTCNANERTKNDRHGSNDRDCFFVIFWHDDKNWRWQSQQNYTALQPQDDAMQVDIHDHNGGEKILGSSIESVRKWYTGYMEFPITDLLD